MKTQKIRWIIAVSVISLLCLLVFQLLWLKQTQTTNEAMARQIVKQALDNAVASLEKKAVYKVMNKYPHGDKHIKDMDIRVSAVDSMYDTVMSEGGIDTIFSKTIKKNRKITRKSEVMIIRNDSSTSDEDLKTRIDSIVGDILSDIKMDSLKTINRLNTSQVDSILKKSLENQNIVSAYAFAICDVKGNIILKSENYDDIENYRTYTANFFHLSIGNKKNKMKLKLAGIDSYLQKPLYALGAIILALTIAIGLTFFVSIKTILNQKKLNTMKNDFINNMTHEFKTPIATISLAADALKTDISTQKQTQHFAEVIKQESQNMNQKVETLLQMALVEQQQIKLNKERVGVNSIIDETLKHLKLKIDTTETELQIQYLENEVFLLVDKHHTRNVLTNIIDNAIKYSGASPQISVNTKKHNGQVIVSISDKGIGMSNEEQKRVFDKFYRAQTGNIHNTKGFGLGLSYAKQIIELHGGQILIESQKGQGTTVTLKLPTTNGEQS
jgi:two-component system phosphate regulon sensor histidine kinase PhoR